MTTARTADKVGLFLNTIREHWKQIGPLFDEPKVAQASTHLVTLPE